MVFHPSEPHADPRVPRPLTPIRVLFLADSHLGFDLPSRPRVERRRRGYDFLANYGRALALARSHDVDLVVHGGDVFHRARVHRSLAYQAARPLVEIAELGVPVLVVPGNHERSRIPHERFASHPNLHLFRRPDTAAFRVRGARVAVAGFPYQRRRVREGFPEILRNTGWYREDADLRFLCMHHCVEGAVVGPGDHTFRSGPDVIRCSDLPAEFAAVLSGHIHRPQVLLGDLDGKPLASPVLYPGSLERTAFAEIGEEKGVLLLEFETGADGGELVGYEFVRLPARPMLARDLVPEGGSCGEWSVGDLPNRIAALVEAVPRDAVFRILVHGSVPSEVRSRISAARLRGMAPTEMNLEILLAEDRPGRNGRVGDRTAISGPRARGTPHDAEHGVSSPQLSLALS